MDVRDQEAVHLLGQLLEELRAQGVETKALLEAILRELEAIRREI